MIFTPLPAQNPVSVIEGDRFKAVGISGQTAIPPNSQIIDIKGKAVLPGFIDGQAHWEGFKNEIYLYVGITSIANIQLYQPGC